MKINANLLTKPTISFSLSQKIERIEFQIEFFQILVKLWNCTHVNHRILFQIGFFFSRDDLKIILVKIKLHSRSWNTRRRVLLRTVFHYSQLCQYKSNVNVNLIISFIKNSKLVMLLKVSSWWKNVSHLYFDGAFRWIIYASNLFKCSAIFGNWLNILGQFRETRTNIRFADPRSIV